MDENNLFTSANFKTVEADLVVYHTNPRTVYDTMMTIGKYKFDAKDVYETLLAIGTDIYVTKKDMGEFFREYGIAYPGSRYGAAYEGPNYQAFMDILYQRISNAKIVVDNPDEKV